MKVIQVLGGVYSGKSSYSNKLLKDAEKKYQLGIKLSFALNLKKMVYKHFGLSKTFEQATNLVVSSPEKAVDDFLFAFKSKRIKEQDLSAVRKELIQLIGSVSRAYYSGDAKSYNLIMRKIYQFIGTDFVRNMISKTFWISPVVEKIMLLMTAGFDLVVIDDTRFENENLSFACKRAGIGHYFVVLDVPAEVRAARAGISISELKDMDSHRSEVELRKLVETVRDELGDDCLVTYSDEG